MSADTKPQRRSLTGGLGAIRNTPSEETSIDQAARPTAVREVPGPGNAHSSFPADPANVTTHAT